MGNAGRLADRRSRHMNRTYRLADEVVASSVLHKGPEAVEVTSDCAVSTLRLTRSGRQLIFSGERQRYRTITARTKDRVFVWMDGRIYELQELEETSGGEAGVARDDIRAPMPGTVLKLNVKVGDSVAADEIVAVLEAMKMEHNLRAPRAGVIASVSAHVGQTVVADAPLVSLEQA
ncbi:MAG: acetyl-CoA carboxylase biotin carboxyl carrier protein subunit [bacterium]|nr:acetyl-CoA carboxylase biotin carboxyl carrier protein subunit [bacterium]